MKILVNVFHPKLDKSTVNRLWVERLSTEANVTVRNIYELYPDGKIDVAAEQAALSAHDRLVFQHPFYWYSIPPLMKQWLDDVLTYGWAYGDKQALKGKELMVAVTTGGGEEFYQKDGLAGHTVAEFLVAYETIASYLDMQYGKMFVVGGCLNISDDEISAQVPRYQAVLSA